MRVIGDLSKANARRHPDKVALVHGGRALTYLELESRSNQLAHALGAAGLRPGDRLGLLACNHLDYAVVTQGAAKAGVLLVPLNFRLSPRELAVVLQDAQLSLLVTERCLAPLWQAALQTASATALPVVLLEDADDTLPMADRRDRDAGVESAAPQVAAEANDVWPGATWLAEWLTPFPDAPPLLEVDPESPCAIMYTSGTTGTPKGVLVPHRAYFRMYLGTAMETGLSRDDRYLMAVPMFHAAGLNLMLHQCLFMGATGVIHRGSLDPLRLFALVEAERLTMAVLVPTVIGQLARHPDRHRFDLSSLRTAFYGSMPMPATVFAAARASFPEVEFHQIYGSTESGLLGVLPWRDHATHAHCTGREALYSHLRIVNDAGEEVADGEVGEVLGAATGGMLGYWNNPAATAKRMRADWIHTGDLARREGDGYFTLVGRVEELIISGGENIHATEVEHALATHPAVREAAVFGMADETFGEVVYAAVVLHTGMTADEAVLDTHCRTQLASYKRPRHYRFLEALPRNASDKVQKSELRAAALQPANSGDTA